MDLGTPFFPTQEPNYSGKRPLLQAENGASTNELRSVIQFQVRADEHASIVL